MSQPLTQQEGGHPSSTSSPPPSTPSTLSLLDLPAGSSGLSVNGGVFSHLCVMARYHVWASELLLEHLTQLSDEEYHRDLGLFFHSLHGTLVHLLCADRVWLARFTDSGPSGCDHLWLDDDKHVWEQFMTDREKVAKEWMEGAKKLESYVNSLSASSVCAPFSYRNTKGQEFTALRSLMLTHIFNHGAHHRGQITSGLSMLGHSTPPMDLLYMLNRKA